MLNIRKFYLFFSSMNYNYGEDKKKDFLLKSDYLLVFKEYIIKVSLGDFLSNKPKELKNLFLYIFFLKDQISYQLMKSLLENKHYILYKNSKENNDKNETIESLNNFLIKNINFKGYKEFVEIINNTIKNNEYLSYKICVLKDKANKPQVYKSIPMDELINNYCIYSFICNEKKLLKNCYLCKKKEINETLQSMGIGEKKIIYLKSHGRYIILERLNNQFIKQELDDENLKYLYIKYGFSLYYNFLKNKKLFKEEILKFIHEIYCD